MIHEYFHHILSNGVLLTCCVLMITLFVIDLGLTLGARFISPHLPQISFASTIVSTGLFATFVGVLIGLYGFDSSNIGNSVPHLLEGLRFAFAGSVLGMFLSLVLSILHKLLAVELEHADVLERIEAKLGQLITVIQSPQQFVRQFAEMKDFLREQLEQINISLDRALDQLARGATHEVTQALEKIIREFNQNLTTQFGDNFKELNVACRSMVEWQRQYKVHVDTTEKHLQSVVTSLDHSTEAARQMVGHNQSTLETCREVGRLLKAYDIQIERLESQLQTCRTLGEEAGKFFEATRSALTRSADNIGNFSRVIENSIGKQSESLAQLTKDLDEQIPAALGQLENVLTAITQQFAADYRSLFEFVTDKR